MRVNSNSGLRTRIDVDLRNTWAPINAHKPRSMWFKGLPVTIIILIRAITMTL